MNHIFKVGDKFVDTDWSCVGFGEATVIEVTENGYVVIWASGQRGYREKGDPDLRKLTKLERAMK